MMADLRASGADLPDWPTIRKRIVVDGHRPKDIARDYPSLTPKQIRDKSYKEGWNRQRDAFSDELTEQEGTIKKRIVSRAGRLLDTMTRKLEDEIELRGPFIMDGEGFPCKVHLDAYKAVWNAYFKDDETINLNVGGKQIPVEITFKKPDDNKD